MLLARGALDGHYIIPVAPQTRHGMYFKPFVLPRWALHLPDSNDYNGIGDQATADARSGPRIISWRPCTFDCSAPLMHTICLMVLALPAAATNPLLPSRLIAVAIAPP